MVSKGEYITSLELEELNERSKKVYFKSMYNFINQHRGYRPSNIHLFLGTSGGGKSTAVRSLLVDALPRIKRGKKVLLWLSEETVADFTTELGKTGIVEHGRVLLERLHIFSEQECEFEGPAQILNEFIRLIETNEYEIVFLDNITTSEFYMDKKPDVQAMVIKKIKAVIQKSNAVLNIVAHTNAEVSDSSPRLINANDIRGSKSIVNLSQFIYILQRFVNDDNIFQTLRIVKNRGQLVNKSIFLLRFCKETFLFKDDKPISFEIFKEAFKTRNTLK